VDAVLIVVAWAVVVFVEPVVGAASAPGAPIVRSNNAQVIALRASAVRLARVREGVVVIVAICTVPGTLRCANSIMEV
jgi:hypothetical protein